MIFSRSFLALINWMTYSSPSMCIIWSILLLFLTLVQSFLALSICTCSSQRCYMTFLTWYMSSISFCTSMSPLLYFYKFCRRRDFRCDVYRSYLSLWQMKNLIHFLIRYLSLSLLSSSYFFFCNNFFFESLISYFLSKFCIFYLIISTSICNCSFWERLFTF